jgi:cardiolipin synthase A/B
MAQTDASVPHVGRPPSPHSFRGTLLEPACICLLQFTFTVSMDIDSGMGATGSWILGAVGALLALILLLLAFVAITWAVRGTPVRRVRAADSPRGTTHCDSEPPQSGVVAPAAAGTDEFARVAALLSGTSLTDGNDVQYFFSGDSLYDALFADVARAERLVTWHVFWTKPGRLADRVADVLAERARAGVQVVMLFDYFGSKGIGQAYLDRLRDAGVTVAVFRRPRWNTLYKAQHRMHIRAVVIDGRTGYTGGFGIDDRWLGDGRQQGQWRDTSARIEGATVAQLQAAFVSNWAEATGDLLLGEAVFGADGGERGAHTAGLMYSSPSLGSTVAERFFFMAVTAARQRWWLTSAYFVPNRQFRHMLCMAAARGVDVRVLTPGRNTDRPSTWYAARAHFDELLAGGVRLYEYRPTMVHAKTLVVDGVWSMVGTLNFDNRSMVLNDEVGLLAWHRDLGHTLEQAFLADLEWADELSLDRERARTTWPDRARMWPAQWFSRLL